MAHPVSVRAMGADEVDLPAQQTGDPGLTEPAKPAPKWKNPRSESSEVNVTSEAGQAPQATSKRWAKGNLAEQIGYSW